MRKKESANVGSQLAHLRWDRASKTEKRAHALKMVAARRAKAKQLAEAKA